MKPQLHLRFHFFLIRHLRIVNEGSSSRVRRLFSGGRILEALDNSLLKSELDVSQDRILTDGFPRSIMTNDHSDRTEKLDNRYLLVIERTYSTYREFI